MPHPPTAACESVHCYFHDEDEPSDSSLAFICGECLHTFHDNVALIEADNARRVELEMGPRPPADLEHIQAAIAGDNDALFCAVACCPFCAHSF